VLEKKNEKLLVAFTAFWRIFSILRSLDIRADVRHGEALVFFAGAGGTFPEILFTLVQGKFFSAVNAHIFSRADLLSRSVRLLFSQLIHQNFHARQRYI
jgi:predicted Rossmann-fold nucleotide-binding protein